MNSLNISESCKLLSVKFGLAPNPVRLTCKLYSPPIIWKSCQEKQCVQHKLLGKSQTKKTSLLSKVREILLWFRRRGRESEQDKRDGWINFFIKESVKIMVPILKNTQICKTDE